MEKECLDLLLSGDGPIVVVLARAMGNMRISYAKGSCYRCDHNDSCARTWSVHSFCLSRRSNQKP
jgi:hypothetical protein